MRLSYKRMCRENHRSTRRIIQCNRNHQPYADLETITLSINLETEKLTTEGITIMCGGTIDVGRKSQIGLHYLINLAKKIESACVIMVDVPNQYDVRNSSCVKMEVTVFNRKMHKIMKKFLHIQTQHMTEERKNCSAPKLQMNFQGESWTSKKIVQKILNLFTLKSGNKIIPLQWEDMKVNTTTINYDNQQVQIPEEINSDMCGIEEVPLNVPQEQEQP